MLDTFIVAVLLLFFNFILIAKRIPIVSIPVAVFTIYVAATKFLTDATIPVHVEFSFFVMLMAIMNIFANVLKVNEK